MKWFPYQAHGHCTPVVTNNIGHPIDLKDLVEKLKGKGMPEAGARKMFQSELQEE